MSYFAALANVFLFSAVAWAQTIEPCGAIKPTPGPVPGFASGRFDAQVKFWNEAEGAECHLFSVGGAPVGYIALYHITRGHLFAFRCVEPDPSFRFSGGQRYGIMEWQLSELVSSQLRSLPIPGWSLVANPAFHGPHVAYWRVLDSGVSAAIYNLIDERVVADQATDLPLPETDFPAHFPRPFWRPDQGIVEFFRYGSAEPLAFLTLPR